MEVLVDSHNQDAKHTPVLLNTIIENIKPNGMWIDGTFGAGGYSRSLLEKGVDKLFAIDRDPLALKSSRRLQEDFPKRFTFLLGKFSETESLINNSGNGSTKCNGIIFDLGVSSMQLDEASRGFSFNQDGPLDMRMGESSLSADDIINFYDEESIADILFQYGEEKLSRIIAKKIVAARPIKSTLELADIIKNCFVPYPFKKIHPATKSFQALRIAVNDELVELVKGLRVAEKLLKPGGQLVVVTFHSLEDRVVKRFVRSRTDRRENSNRHAPISGEMTPSFKLKRVKPYLVKSEEKKENNRSRSAKLRIAIRTDALPYQNQEEKLGLPKLAIESLT